MPKNEENEIEVTPEMVEAAEKSLWDQAARFNIVTLDEMHHDTIRLMIRATLHEVGAPRRSSSSEN